MYMYIRHDVYSSVPLPDTCTCSTRLMDSSCICTCIIHVLGFLMNSFVLTRISVGALWQGTFHSNVSSLEIQ